MEEIDKSSAGCSVGNKFIVNCADRIFKTKTTKSWLTNLLYLETISLGKAKMSDKKILQGILDTNKNVVVKISKTIEDALQHEWKTFVKLKEVKVPNVLNYYCYFECVDDFDSINPVVPKESICKDSGKGINVLIMDYVKNKSFGDYPWHQVSKDIFHSCCKQVVLSLAEAHKTIGFRHGDSHAKNVLIKQTTCTEIHYPHINRTVSIPKGGFKVYLMDFELSKTDQPINFHWRDVDEFFNSIYKLLDEYVNLRTITEIKMYLAQQQNNSIDYSIDHLFHLIDKL